jgi:predicted transcriptional regulator
VDGCVHEPFDARLASVRQIHGTFDAAVQRVDAVASQGACGMSEVSERFEITPAAASQLVDKLVQSGLIVREEDPSDRRAKLLDLTEKGELVQQGHEERYRWVDELGPTDRRGTRPRQRSPRPHDPRRAGT